MPFVNQMKAQIKFLDIGKAMNQEDIFHCLTFDGFIVLDNFFFVRLPPRGESLWLDWLRGVGAT